MRTSLVVALVGDYNPSVPAHQAIPSALDMAAAHHGVKLHPKWVSTVQTDSAERTLRDFNGILCVPASPYQNTRGALGAIRFAHEQRLPFLGTCAGFQHALLEFAKNVLGMPDPAHADLEPQAAHPLIAPLRCNLIDEEMELLLEPGSRLHQSYETNRIREQYRCSYGPNPESEKVLFSREFVIQRATAQQSHASCSGFYSPFRRAFDCKRDISPIWVRAVSRDTPLS
jgi:CTP synthase (UTP-ammonia lyase)